MSGVNIIDFTTLTVGATAVGLDSAGTTLPNNAKGARIVVQGAQIRYREDGTNPTASVGNVLDVGDILPYDSWTYPGSNWRQALKAVKFIRSASTSATLAITYYD